MNAYLAPGLVALFLFLLIGVAVALILRRRLSQRNESLRLLLELADRLEADIRNCRQRLQQAHAVMSLNPDLPAASEQEARQAIDNGLRALLQQRIWIRDQSARASQQELDAAAHAMASSRARMQPLLAALGQAQHDLDAAVREHIHGGPET